jgi:hypothetical protein
MIWSMTKKKNAAATDIAKTIAVVTSVSLRDGHVTFAASCRTCRMNSPGLTFWVVPGLLPFIVSTRSADLLPL